MAYGFYASITVDNTKVSGSADLSNFPVLVTGTYDGTGGEPDLRTTGNGGNIQNTDSSGGASGAYTVPADLAFYNDTDRTTQYDHEVENYDAATGAFTAWVRIPTLLYNSDTTFYMHYGDSAVTTTQENVGGTWEANYKGVYHLAESGNGTADEYKDSSGNAHHGQGGGGNSTYTPAQTTGQIAKGVSSNGDDFIQVADHADFDISGDMSFAGWWYLPDYSRYYWLMCKGDGSFGYNWALYIVQTTGKLTLGGFSPATATAASPSTGAWHHIAVTFASGTAKIWIDGSSETFTGRSIGSTNNYPLYLMWNNYSGQKPPNGTKYDEMRVYSGTPLDAWIVTEYNNQNAPGTFYTMGSETTASPAAGGQFGMMMGVGN